MIFVTIGTQAPFNRFIKAIDEIAKDISEPIIAQVYKNTYTPHNIKTVDFLDPDEFNKLFNEARIIVSHAGMGTIISAMTKDKPIIIFPRLASLGEHRNEHQLYTAMEFDDLGYVYVAYDKKQLKDLMLERNLKSLHHISMSVSKELINSLVNYIDGTN